jgi:arginine/lysine/ornithine decarboxylase
MDHNKTPLFDALMKYREKQRYSFHVPGHKDGLTFYERGKRIYESILSIDATEVYGLDDLYEPTEAIAEAQNLLKDLYGTVKSYFLVNGSTVGNLVMVMAACRPGDKVIVQRNSHKSIFNALKLARIKPIFLSPEIGSEWIPTGLNKEMVHLAVEKNPDTKALILTYPNYYGMAKKDYKEIIDWAKNKGIMVLVDEAHGAHFTLGDPVPQSTLKMGADIVIQSAHKTLPAMTMGSYLHVNTRFVSIQAIEQALEMLQTSSPSYPIMASLDLARAYLASISQQQLQGILENITSFKRDLNRLGFHVITDESVEQDPFKIVLSTGVNGFQLQKSMERVGIYPEMADPYHVLITLAIGGQIPYKHIIPSFGKVKEELHLTNSKALKRTTYVPSSDTLSSLVIDYGMSERLAIENVPLRNAGGRVSAQMVVPYPPGVPILIDGELVDDDHLEQIKIWQSVGARFHGLDETSYISVYKT